MELAIVTDTKNLVEKEMPAYVVIAVLLCCLVLAITMDSFMIPVLFMLSIGMAIIYNLGTNFVKGEISFITMSLVAVLQLGVTMDYSIFLWGSYKEQRSSSQITRRLWPTPLWPAITSVAGSSLTTIAGFIALCFRALRWAGYGHCHGQRRFAGRDLLRHRSALPDPGV